MARSLLNATMPPGRPTANSSVVNALASQHRSSGRCGGHSRAVSTTCTSSMSRRKTGPSSDEGLQPPHTIRQSWLPAARNPLNIKADDRATSQPSQHRNVTHVLLEVAVETRKAVTKILFGQKILPIAYAKRGSIPKLECCTRPPRSRRRNEQSSYENSVGAAASARRSAG